MAVHGIIFSTSVNHIIEATQALNKDAQKHGEHPYSASMVIIGSDELAKSIDSAIREVSSNKPEHREPNYDDMDEMLEFLAISMAIDSARDSANEALSHCEVETRITIPSRCGCSCGCECPGGSGGLSHE